MNVSIIIINHNSFQILTDCLDSIIEHTKPNVKFEIIVIDNNSTEGDIKSLLKKYTQVKLVVNSENLGFAAANNQGIKLAKGEYILFLNNDTLFIEDTINKILDFYEKSNQISIVGCRLLNVDKTIQASIVNKDSIFNSIGENFFLYKIFKKNKKLNRWYYSQIKIEKPTQVDIVKGAFIFCPQKIINNLVGFDERFYFYAEETDFCLRALSKGYKIWYVPLTEIIHIGGYSTDKNLWFKFKNQSIARIQIFQKHYKGVRFYILTSLHYWGIFMRVGVYLILGLITFNIPLLKKSGYYALQLLIYPKNLFKED